MNCVAIAFLMLFIQSGTESEIWIFVLLGLLKERIKQGLKITRDSSAIIRRFLFLEQNSIKFLLKNMKNSKNII